MSKISFNDLIKSDTPVLVDFHATWCGPCKAFAPILQNFKDEMKGNVRIVKVDIDKNQALASRLGIRSVPTIHLYQKGELKWSASGVQPASELRKRVNALAV